MIIEAALLTDEEKVSACVLSKAAGADYREDVYWIRLAAQRLRTWS